MGKAIEDMSDFGWRADTRRGRLLTGRRDACASASALESERAQEGESPSLAELPASN